MEISGRNIPNMKCVSYGCVDDAYYLIVYGCFDAHIREMLLCFEHGEAWAIDQSHRDIACAQCHQPVEEYEFQWMDKLKGLAWT